MRSYPEKEVRKFLKELEKITEEERSLILDFDKRMRALWGIKTHAAHLVTELEKWKKKKKHKRKLLSLIRSLKKDLGHFFHLREQTTTDVDLEKSLGEKEEVWLHRVVTLQHYEYVQLAKEFQKGGLTKKKALKTVNLLMNNIEKDMREEHEAGRIINHLDGILGRYSNILEEQKQALRMILQGIWDLKREVEGTKNFEQNFTEIDGAKHELLMGITHLENSLRQEKVTVILPFNKFLLKRRTIYDTTMSYIHKRKITYADIAADLETLASTEVSRYLVAMTNFSNKMTAGAKIALTAGGQLASVLARREKHFSQLGKRDAVTGVETRAAFKEALEKFVRESTLLSQKGRDRAQFTLVMGDIDFFKNFNDSYGHQVGDDVLAFVGRTLMKSVRKGDRVFRYGGEEFAILMRGIDSEGAHIAIERTRTTIFDDSKTVMRTLNTLPGIKGKKRYISMSFGLAEFPGDARTGKQLIEFADRALYQAKKAGRNRIVVWKE